MRTSLVVLAAVIGQALGQALINTPASLITCQPALLSWSGGAPEYFLSILPGGQSGGTPLKQFPQQSGTSLTWVVDLAAGTSITLSVRDSTGAVNYSDQVSITAGTDSSCVSGDVAASGQAGGVALTSSATAALSSVSSSLAAATSATMSMPSGSAAMSSASSLASSASSALSSAKASVTSELSSAVSSLKAASSAASASAPPSSSANRAVLAVGSFFGAILAAVVLA